MKWIKKIVNWIKEKLDPLSPGSSFILTEDEIDAIEQRAEEREATKEKNTEPYDGMEP